MAFYRSEIYKKLEDVEMQRYWLTQSAITDIRNAIMDQGALWSLANSLIRDNDDLDRAHNYIDFSWQCLTRFSTHMRSWLVAPVVTKINQEYKERLQATNQRLWWLIAVISLLAVIILLSLVYVSKKRKQLATARERLASLNTQLSTMNNELSETNKQLSDTNEQLRHAIIHLNDSNRVKDEYIGKFLSICSEYIDKLDNYRIKINRKLKANQHTDLLRMTGSEQLKEDELKELYDNFDTVFLNLFPTFINDFNALLRPEDRIVPTGKSLLNTDLRIFALIRLGIDESSKIAEFLHYSPNSIYAYRARIKNKAAGNREDFEQLVKEIGIYE
ncbi:MAG: transcriptional regulator [Prevotella sp.]|nr:transcriptional regulator [Prevotella sp.]